MSTGTTFDLYMDRINRGDRLSPMEIRELAETPETARRLHLSVRAVTYRLDRVEALTGYDPTDPAQRFTIHAAVLGAKLLGWPQRGLTLDR